ncbi:hypothetical protein [Nocardioides ochotonae]|uniref:hypothetical protein n=1 Tax=Nocardioides ochotonae TaxID=2685869 RepID=UPI001CD512C7|nr:hypothetical protein [Nocardioides ochotonae]
MLKEGLEGARDGARGGRVRVEPIHRADLPEVGAFLHAHLNGRLSPAQWAAAADPTWPGEAPNHGFLLRAGEGADAEVVGVQLAFYAERPVDGVPVRFCNLAAWCVREDQRSHGLRLLRAVLAQRGHVFTDLSPSGSVVPLNERLGFEHLDTTTALVANLPGLGRGRVVTDLDEIEARLEGEQRRILRDHRGAAAARHLLVVAGGEQCYVVYRRDRRRGLRLFATLLHVEDPAVLARHQGVLGRHLLARGLPVTLAEMRLLSGRPAASVLLARPRPKMFRGTGVPASAVDNLYSELALVAW